ncbi:MAG: 50S ribosomal protein L11 methyltransferase [Cyclonatronaceae bacterium]
MANPAVRFVPVILIIMIIPVFPATSPLQAQDLDVPYYTTETEVVKGMLDMAGVGPGDYLIDLGSGDGRIVIAAALRGAVAHGVDLDPERNREARRNARDAGMDDRVLFLEQDLFETDYSQATVVTLFLLESVNLRLKPALLDRLRPGARVVSHTFDMGEWEPDEQEVIGIRPVYLWVIPARVDGEWSWHAGNERFTMSVDQRFQKLKASVTSGGQEMYVERVAVHGERITLRFRHPENGTRYTGNGEVSGDRLSGIMQIHGENSHDVETWHAGRSR